MKTISKTFALFAAYAGLTFVSTHAQLKVLFLASDDPLKVQATFTDILGTDSRFDLANSSAMAWSIGNLPSFATLNQYDAILTWTNTAQTCDISDLLADYVDAGGALVLSTFWGQQIDSVCGAGRLETTGYNPLINARTNAYDSASLGVFDINSPLFDGVSSLNATYYRGDYLNGVDTGATVAGYWSDGNPLLAYNANQNIINLSLFPSVASYNHATGDYQQLFRNSLAFVAEGANPLQAVPEPRTYALLGTALLGLIVIRRRFSKS